MQRRHADRRLYFDELANTSRGYYVNYLKTYKDYLPGLRVLEIGCGEGGNLLPFAEAGCTVTGIDISPMRIRQAISFFEAYGQKGHFICLDFLETEPPASETERYDMIILHDVIEHIEPENKKAFLTYIRPFLKSSGLLFVAFPVWQMPFGGHQQTGHGLSSMLPFIHLLPNPAYRFLLRISGNTPECIDELMSIKRSKMTPELFSAMATSIGFKTLRQTLWLINPHYKQKFGISPIKLSRWVAHLPYIRNFFTTSAFYLLNKGE